ncbi:MAG: GTP pyrophosphokinase family protein [Clostridiales bacterium]|nr:GTP pyrophosphokinase family protein [Clostridiales bacterium]
MIPPQMTVTLDDAREMVKVFSDLRMRYQAAIKEVSTKLDILDNEFSVRMDYNPIHHMECRLKSMKSIVEKIKRKGWALELESVYKVTDFAGIRVICNYIDDVYTIEESLLRQDDIKLIRRKDYIKNPKESGYRSLHLVVEIPIFLSERTYSMPVEIQIRTIAMDTWASLEHELKYKRNEELPPYALEELKECAKSMAAVDESMERIHKMY